MSAPARPGNPPQPSRPPSAPPRHQQAEAHDCADERAARRLRRNAPRAAAGQRAGQELRARVAGARRASRRGSRQMARRAHRHSARHRRTRNPHRRHRAVGDAARPQARARRLAHRATPTHVQQAIAAARKARTEWANWAWEDRAAVFLRAAELLATTWRATLNAATMLGQSKTVFQAEIDSACELIDFWRFNPAYAQELYAEQPLSTTRCGTSSTTGRSKASSTR